MFAAAVVPLLLVPLLSQGAPQQGQASERSEATGDSLPLTLVNPFGSADESRRLLQSYIKTNLKEQANPDVNTWEQEVFFLFSLHDYDKSNHLDGLELMKLLSDFLSHHSQTPKSTDGVVAMVDYLLQTQDQNQDGLLAPSELLSPPIKKSGSEPEPGADPAEQQQQEELGGEPAQKAEPDGPADAANEPKPPQEETQHQPEEHQEAQGDQVPEEQNVDKQRDAGEEEQKSEQEPAPEPPEMEGALEQQRQAEEHRLESNAVEQQDHPPVHQGQPEM